MAREPSSLRPTVTASSRCKLATRFGEMWVRPHVPCAGPTIGSTWPAEGGDKGLWRVDGPFRGKSAPLQRLHKMPLVSRRFEAVGWSEGRRERALHEDSPQRPRFVMPYRVS